MLDQQLTPVCELTLVEDLKSCIGQHAAEGLFGVEDRLIRLIFGQGLSDIQRFLQFAMYSEGMGAWCSYLIDLDEFHDFLDEWGLIYDIAELPDGRMNWRFWKAYWAPHDGV